MRDSNSRMIMRAIQANLDAGRLTPEQIKTNLKVAEELRDTSRDDRVRLKAIGVIQAIHQWQTEYEAPKTQQIALEHKYPQAIEIRTTASLPHAPIVPLRLSTPPGMPAEGAAFEGVSCGPQAADTEDDSEIPPGGMC
jgi:hypothetical protein